MKKTIYYCDLCGVEIKRKYSCEINIRYGDSCHDVDICHKCYIEYKKLETKIVQMVEDFLKERGFFKEIKE